MKKCLVFFSLIMTIMINIYLLYYWEPENRVSFSEKESKEVVTYVKPLYKVNKERVLEQLSSSDKADLERIIKKLSAFDMGRIKECYEEADEEKGAIGIFNLLRKRLTSEDYKRIEEISSQILDLKRVEGKEKNN